MIGYEITDSQLAENNQVDSRPGNRPFSLDVVEPNIALLLQITRSVEEHWLRWLQQGYGTIRSSTMDCCYSRRDIAILDENETWMLTDLPKGWKATKNKRKYKTKRGPDGAVERLKATVVVEGCMQRFRIVFEKSLLSRRTLLNCLISDVSGGATRFEHRGTYIFVAVLSSS